MDAKRSNKTRLASRHDGSTDVALHIPAIAAESTIDFVEIFKKTPYAAGLKPQRRDAAKDMVEIGKIPLEMKTLCDLGADAGSLNVKLTGTEPAEHETKWKALKTNLTSGVPRDGRTRNSVMRTSRRIIFALIFGAAPLAAPAFAFDGAPANPQDTAIPVVSTQPGTAAALKKAVPPSTTDTSLTSLQYAAEGGHPVAQWKLGRMYADGDGVTQGDLLAFDYFSRIANAHAEDSPSAPQAAIVANAFVALGRYYLSGIPNSKIKSDPERAREMFSYAASYFGNADAQYDLARLYLNGVGMPRECQIRRALARPCRPEGPAPGPGHARPDAVQRRPTAAAGRARPDVADAGPGRHRARREPGSRKATTRRSPKRPRTTAPWRCRCSSTGCRAARTDIPAPPGTARDAAHQS